MEVSLTTAILIATITFALGVAALSLAVRLGLGKQAEKLIALREAQEKSLELARGSRLESGERLEQARQRLEQQQARADDLHRRAEANADRADRLWERSDKNQDRWDKALTRIEALVEKLE